MTAGVIAMELGMAATLQPSNYRPQAHLPNPPLTKSVNLKGTPSSSSTSTSSESDNFVISKGALLYFILACTTFLILSVVFLCCYRICGLVLAKRRKNKAFSKNNFILPEIMVTDEFGNTQEHRFTIYDSSSNI